MKKIFRVFVASIISEETKQKIKKAYEVKYKLVHSLDLSKDGFTAFTMSEPFSREDLAEVAKLCNFKESSENVTFEDITLYSNVVEPKKDPPIDPKPKMEYVTKKDFDEQINLYVTKKDFDDQINLFVTKVEFDELKTE